MKNDYKFQQTKVHEEVSKKLFIERLPEWMQNVEQIQKFSDDIIQQWFNPVEEEVIDGYIGDITSPARTGKIFLKESTTQRQLYQLSPAYVSRNVDNTVNTVQFYEDLVSYLKLYGCITDNQDRIFSSKYYAWTPAINPNKIQNFGSYVWDNNNEYGITPDYVVMERGSIDGNTWSLQNYWYTIGQKLPNGIVLTESMTQDSRFIRAQAPIIEFNKNIELMNYGNKFRGVVDYFSDTVKPDDIVQRAVTDNIKVDGYILKHGDRVLFTSIGNSGENNRIYKVYIKTQLDGTRVYGLSLDEDELTDERPTGEPLNGDVVLIKSGNVYKNVSMYWNGKSWIRAQEKNGTNAFPKFKLFDKNGTSLGDQAVYPGTDFSGSSLFGLKINFDYSLSKIYNAHVELNEYNYYIFENFLQSERYYYNRVGVRTEIDGLYYFSKRKEDGSYELMTDWVRSKENSKQFVKQAPEIHKISMYKIFNTLRDMNTFEDVLPDMNSYVLENDSYYTYVKNELSGFYNWTLTTEEKAAHDEYNREYELSQKIDSTNPSDEMTVVLDGEILTKFSTVKNGDFIEKIIIDSDVEITDNSVLSIRTYSANILPDLSLGAYEIPMNMQYNPYNENITFVDQSEYALHMYDIIKANITTGSISDINDYELQLEEGNVDNSTGTHIVQNEASFLPMMLSSANANIDLFEAMIFTRNEYFRFKNKFNTILVEMYKKDPDFFNTETANNIVDIILNRINLGKDSSFPFYIDSVGSTVNNLSTFIPPTPHFLGMLKAFIPQKSTYIFAGREMVAYNVDHTGAISKSYKAINSAPVLDDVVYELEMRIYNSIDTKFKDIDYTPLLNSTTLKPTMFFKSTEYNAEEYNHLLLRGYINFIASKNISNETHEYDPNNWMTWNFKGALYSNDNTVASGSWRAIYTNAYGTYRPHTHPWEMFGFSNRPDWFNQEYEPTKVQIGKKSDEYVYVYTTYVENENGDTVSTGLWDSTEGAGDVSTGTIKFGKNAGSHPEFVRFGIQPFTLTSTSEISENGEPIFKLELISPMDLGILVGSLEYKAEPWAYGDMGEMEFTYMNTPLFAYDNAMALYRAKPAAFCNYFLDTKNNELQSIAHSTEKQFLYGNTRLRTNFNSSTIVHTENNTKTLGTQVFISNYLIYQNKNVTTNYGDILRASFINVGHRIGAFTEADQLTFKSDSFGLISQENQHIGLVRSIVGDEETLSAVKITYNGIGYVLNGYDLIGGVFKVQVPNKLGRRTSVEVGTQLVTHYNEYTDEVQVYPYGTLLKTSAELYNFICAYGEYLQRRGWIFEDMTSEGKPNNWDSLAFSAVEWTQTKPAKGNFISISPSTINAKFGSTFGSVLSVTQFSGGVWTLMDDQNNGIRQTDIDTARIGNVLSIRIADDVEKRMALIRLHLNSFEHAVVFDDRTIFGDDIYIPKFGSIFEMLKMYGYSTANWNGRLESKGFIILEQGTIPNFEKTVTDFQRYYDPDTYIDNNTIQGLSRHLIGYQTRNYISQMISNESSQVDFYRGFIKEKGTNASFEKVLRVSKTYSTDNYRALQEWAFKIGSYGNVDDKKHLQFQLLNDQILQEPQMFIFDQYADDSVVPDTTYIKYYGTEGEDYRWITRPKGKNFKFPMRTGNSTRINLPDIGPVTLDEVSYSTVDFDSAYTDRINFINSNNSMPTSVWVLRDSDNTWNIYELVDTGTVLESITPIDDESELTETHCELLINAPHGLVDGEIYYFVDDTEFMPDPLNVERQYFSAGTNNTIVIPLNLANTIVFTDNKPKLYKYKLRYDSTQREQYVQSKLSFGAVESSLFARPSTYNSNTNITEMFLNVYDPINGVIPGSIMSNIKYINTFDPALYNNEGDENVIAWGSEKIGEVWWDTTNAFFLNYTVPILDQNGEVDIIKSLEYKRTNWGKLLNGGSIDVYEWVASPVPPFNWDTYVEQSSKLNKDTKSWVPSGKANEANFSVFQEYNSSTGAYSTVYYFWAKSTIYLPKVPTRTKSTMELSRAILNPLVFNTPWFAPVDSNAFIISGIQHEITDDKSILTLEYTEDKTEVIKHEQFQLCREGEEYNFNPNLWNTMWNSLRSSEILPNGTVNELRYPHNDLGCIPNKIWFMDVLEARREYTRSSNNIFRTKNIVSDAVIMDEIFNVKTEEVNPNLVPIKVLSYNNELVIVPNEDKFVENDAVLVDSSGTLPEPLSSSVVYFVHFDSNGYIHLMHSPSSSGTAMTITLSTRGEGQLTMIKQSDYVDSLGTSLDMTNYWVLADWYSAGFSEFTPYTDEETLDSADLKNYQEGDVIRITDSSGLWTLYERQLSRNVPIWTAVGRQDSTVELTDNIYDGYEQYNSDGTPSNTEINVRKALELLQGAYEGYQSTLIFDMVKYVHVEQKVVDWVFKTSYIYILGLDQSLEKSYMPNDDLINQIMEYFEEAKPYRTKIRSQIEQKTSDSDEINGVVNDLDPNGYVLIDGVWVKTQTDIWDHEFARYNESTNRWEVVGSIPIDFVTPNRRFQEINTVLVYDNVQCTPDITYDYNSIRETAKRYTTQDGDRLTDETQYQLQKIEFSSPEIDYASIDYQIILGLSQVSQEYYDIVDLTSTAQKEIDKLYAHFSNDLEGTAELDENVKTIVSPVMQNDPSVNETAQFVQYNSLANRLRMFTPMNDGAIAKEVKCPFKGVVLSDNTNTRLPFGFSSSNSANLGYALYSTDLYETIFRNVQEINPSYSIDDVLNHMAHEYGLYSPKADKHENGRHYTDTVQVLSIMRNNIDKNASDPYMVSKEIIESMCDVDSAGVVLIPRKLAKVKDINTSVVYDVPLEYSIEEFMELQFTTNNSVLEIVEINLDDVQIDETNPLQNEIQEIVTEISESNYFDDTNAYDNLGLESQYKEIYLESSGIADYSTDPIIIDISSVNPTAMDISNIRVSVSGYSYDHAGEMQLKEAGRFQIEGLAMLNPYNRKQAIISIPKYSEAVENMDRADANKEPIIYSHRVNDIISTAGKVRLHKDHNLVVGDKVMIFTPENSDLEVHMGDGTWKKLIDVNNIKQGTEPVIFDITEVNAKEITLGGMVFENTFTKYDPDLMNPDIGISLNIVRVGTFGNSEFVQGSVSLYSSIRNYRIALMDYDVFYDRILDGAKYGTVDYDVEYISNETVVNVDGVFVDHGFNMPVYGGGVLSEKIGARVTDNLQITVLEYDVSTIQPVFDGIKWNYTGTVVDDVYINDEPARLTNIICDDTLLPQRTLLVKPLAVEDCVIINNTLSSANSMDDMYVAVNSEIVQLKNNKKILGARIGTCSQYYIPSNTYDHSAIVLGYGDDFEEYVNNDYPIPSSKFYNGTLISGTLIEKVLT